MHRRAFIRLLSINTLALAYAKSALAQVTKQNGKKVLVIGAGISGLTAAHKLLNKGYTVQVLEAKSYSGGRILTNRSLGTIFEVGAGWIHSPEGNPISDLVKQINASTIVTDDDSLKVYQKNGPITERMLDELDKAYEKLLEKVDDEIERNQHISLYEAILKVDKKALDDPLMLWALSAFTEFDVGGAIEKISAYYFDEDKGFEGDDVILTNGYDEILNPLLTGLEIQYRQLVKSIDYSNKQIIVQTTNSEYQADFVICSVPLGMLKSNQLQFIPKLPGSYQKSINKIPMANVTKVLLKFPDSFWPVSTQYFGNISNTKGKWPYFVNYRKLSDSNVLLALSFGDYAQHAEKLTDEQIQKELMTVLKRMFGKNIPQPNAILVSRWSKDPFTMGAYSFTGVGVTPKDFNQLAIPVNQRLFLVGEHTTFDYHGTVHGAYLSGITAAEKIINS
jgi:monoamine oxidase